MPPKRTTTNETANVPPSEPAQNREHVFIPVEGNPPRGRDQRALTTVRRHVMRDYIDRQQAESSNSGATSRASRTTAKGEKMKFRLKSGELEEAIPVRQQRANAQAAKRLAEASEAEASSARTRPDSRGTIPTNLLVEDPDVADYPEVNDTPIFEYHEMERILLGSPNGSMRPLAAEMFSEPIPSSSSEEEVPPEDFEMLSGSFEAIQLPPASDTSHQVLTLPTAPLLPVSSTQHFDPFNILPARLSTFDQHLLSHFRHYESASWCPVSGQSAWFSASLTSPILFHASLYNFAVHLSDRHLRPSLATHPHVLKHKLHSIRRIHAALSDPSVATTDAAIAAVLAIVNAEISHGSAHDAAKHMKGLSIMVSLRGGISELVDAYSGLLFHLLLWTTLSFVELFNHSLRRLGHGACYSRTDCEPGTSLGTGDPLLKPESGTMNDTFSRNVSTVLEVDRTPAEVERQWNEAVSGRILHTDYLDPMSGSTLYRRLTYLLSEVRSLCSHIGAHPFMTLTETEKMRRSDRLLSFERRLRTLAEFGDNRESEPGLFESARIMAMAALIYMHLILRGMALHYPQFDVLSKGLMGALVSEASQAIQARAHSTDATLSAGETSRPGQASHATVLDTWTLSPSMLLWLLSVGVIVSTKRRENARFKVMLRAALERYRVRSEEEYFERVREVLWMPGRDEGRFGVVWEGVVLMEEMLD